MSRRHSAEKREINPDPKFGNMVVSKFMNSIMYEGKKSVAEAIVYGASRAVNEDAAVADAERQCQAHTTACRLRLMTCSAY